jgi:transcriptional regulator with XRE-family HTH domain
MNNRIVELIKAEGLTNSKFASILGIQRSNVTHIVDGRNKPSLSFIEKLISKFPNINIEWLMTGTGEMYKQNNVSVQKTVQNKVESPTLFSQTVTPQVEEIPDVTNMPEQKQTIELKSEESQEYPRHSEQDLKQNPEIEPESQSQTEVKLDTRPEPEKETTEKSTGTKTEQESEREIECVLIFHSDKTFKYYRPA